MWHTAGVRIAAATLMVASIMGGSAARAAVRPGDSEAGIGSHMKVLYEGALEEMAREGIPRANTDVTVIDVAAMYQYSEEKGLRPISLLWPGSAGFADGWQPASPGDRCALIGATDAMPSGTVKPMRRVFSNTGYFKLEGVIGLPEAGDIWGIDGVEGYAEGAFNYFGMKKDGVFDAEVGMCSQYNDKVQDGNRWYGYHSFTGIPWDRDPWPSGGAAPGTSVYIRMWCPQTTDNQIGEYLSASGLGSYTHYWNVTGVDRHGVDQHFRRVTSMVLGEGSPGGLLNNDWAGVSLYSPPPVGGGLWHPEDLWYAQATWDLGVSVVTIYPWYRETVSVDFVP